MSCADLKCSRSRWIDSNKHALRVQDMAGRLPAFESHWLETLTEAAATIVTDPA